MMHSSSTPANGVTAQLGAGQPTHPARITVKLSSIIQHLVDKTYRELIQLSATLIKCGDYERKVALLEYFQRCRHQFIRLLVLVKWSQQEQAVKHCWILQEQLDRQSLCFSQAADQLVAVHFRVQTARAPIYDIPTAIDVLTTGSYPRLPKCIESVIPPPPVSRDDIKRTLRQLNDLIHLRLLFSTKIPPQFRIKIGGGRARLRVPSEFEAILTLDGDRVDAPWRLITVLIFVGADTSTNASSSSQSAQISRNANNTADDSTPPPSAVTMLPQQTQRLVDFLQRRIATAQHPLVDLYSVMHSICNSLALDILHSQAELLRRGRRADAIRVDLDTSGDRKLLTVSYWLQRPSGTVDMSTPAAAAPAPQLQFTVDSDGDLRVAHIPPVVDPSGSNAATDVFTVDTSKLDMERILMRAFGLHVFSLLRKLHDALRTGDAAVSATDISLKFDANDPAGSSLCIRLSTTRSLCVSVDIHTGRYILRAPSRTVAMSTLEDRIQRDPTREISFVVSAFRRSAAIDAFRAAAAALGYACLSRLPIAPASTVSTMATAAAPHAEFDIFGEYALFLRISDVPNVFLGVTVDSKLKPGFFLVSTRPRPLSAAAKAATVAVDIGDAAAAATPAGSAHQLVAAMSTSTIAVPHSLDILHVVTVRALSKNAGKVAPTSPQAVPSAATAAAALGSAVALCRCRLGHMALLRQFTENATSGGGEISMNAPPLSPLPTFSLPYAPTGSATHMPPVVPADMAAAAVAGASLNFKMESLMTGCEPIAIEKFIVRFGAMRGDGPPPWGVDVVERRPFVTIERLVAIAASATQDRLPKKEAVADSANTPPTGAMASVAKASVFAACRNAVPVPGFSPSVSHNAAGLDAVETSDGGCRIRHDATRGLWRFRYAAVRADAYQHFLMDLRGLCRVAALAEALESVLADPLMGPLIRVLGAGPLHLSIAYGVNGHSLTLQWRAELRLFALVFSPKPHPLHLFLEIFFNYSRDLRQFLGALLAADRPLAAIDALVAGRLPAGENDGNAAIDDVRRPLGGDIVAVPRSIAHVRLVFRNTYAVDMRFEPTVVVLADAATPRPSGTAVTAVSTSTPDRLEPMPLLERFFEEKVAPIVGVATMSTSTGAYSVPSEKIAVVLRALWQYLGTVYLWRRARQIVQQLSLMPTVTFTNIDDKPSVPTGAATTGSEISLKFTADRATYVLFVHRYSTLECQIISPAMTVTAAAAAPPGMPPPLSDHEKDFIASFFRKRVSSAPYRTACMTSFLRLLKLQLVVLREFIALFQLEGSAAKSAVSPSSTASPQLVSTPLAAAAGMLRFELALVVPPGVSTSAYPATAGQPAVVVVPNASQVFLIARFWAANAFVDIPLCFSYDAAVRTVALIGAEPASREAQPLVELLKSAPRGTGESILAGAMQAIAQMSFDELKTAVAPIVGVQPSPLSTVPSPTTGTAAATPGSTSGSAASTPMAVE